MLRLKSLNDLPQDLRARQVFGAPDVPRGTPKRSKYRNVKTVVDGISFDSKLESRCYQELKLRRASGEVLWFLRQVSFALPGNVKYRCDFLAVLASGGVEVIDAKGFHVHSSISKIKQVKELYGVEVRLWSGK